MRNRVKKLLAICLLAVYAVGGASSVSAVERVYILPATATKKAPRSNMFQVKGSSEKYIVLDHTEEGFFVLSEKNCAAKPFSVDGNPVAYDPEDPNSIAYWLNHDFLESDKLPEVIKESLVEREYTTEGGGSDVSFSKEYKSLCKVVLLSQTEWSKYNAKFGYGDDTSSAAWILRSVRERGGNPLVAFTSGTNAGLTHEGKWTSTVGIRPAFYLSPDFFEKASVNMASVGDSIKSIIRNNCSIESLEKLYSASEIDTLMNADIAPAAEVVTITGRGIVGEKIVGKYNFVSLDGNEENGTAIQWQRSYNGEVWSTIIGAEGKEYVPTEKDIGYFIRMKVSPMTSSMAGASFTSVALATKIRAISKPKASDVRIIAEGTMKSGKILDVKYIYSDENRDNCSETDYVWESSVDKSAKTAEVIGNERYLKLTENDNGKYVRVGVIPKKKTNSADERITVSGEMVYSDWMKIEFVGKKNTSESTQTSADISREMRDVDGELSLLKTLTAGKTYEVWIVNDENLNSYTYSYKIEGTLPVITSDRYLIKTVQSNNLSHVIGTLVSDAQGGDRCFKAGEITAEEYSSITISDVLTVSSGDKASVSGAKVFVTEK